jgi:flagellar basal-body rod protein FlgB
MAISDIPIFSMLRTRMRWYQERQRLLSENIANADTPNFTPRDLAPLSFDKKVSQAPSSVGSVALARTDPHHLAGSAAADTGGFRTDRKGGFEVRPDGNGVGLEEQMMKVAANQMDYQAATALYSRSLGLIKTALGRG